MAVIQNLVLTFCPTMHSVQQKKLKLLMPVLTYLVYNNLLSIWHPICHKPWLSQMEQECPDLEWFDHCIREEDKQCVFTQRAQAKYL